jgi:hypothetical protein
MAIAFIPASTVFSRKNKFMWVVEAGFIAGGIFLLSWFRDADPFLRSHLGWLGSWALDFQFWGFHGRVIFGFFLALCCYILKVHYIARGMLADRLVITSRWFWVVQGGFVVFIVVAVLALFISHSQEVLRNRLQENDWVMYGLDLSWSPYIHPGDVFLTGPVKEDTPLGEVVFSYRRGGILGLLVARGGSDQLLPDRWVNAPRRGRVPLSSLQPEEDPKNFSPGHCWVYTTNPDLQWDMVPCDRLRFLMYRVYPLSRRGFVVTE